MFCKKSVLEGILNLFFDDSQKLYLLLTSIYENIVPYLFKYITMLNHLQNFSDRFFFWHLVFHTDIHAWTIFIMLNNLMTHFLGKKTFCLWNLIDVKKAHI